MEPQLAEMLTVLKEVPDGFLHTPARELTDVLPGPTLIDLPGRGERPLFVAILLHGNETTGLLAMQKVLGHYQGHPLPRGLLLFVGNIAAAAQARRTLDNQMDFNRVWPGTEHTDAPEARLMREVMEYVSHRRPFASIDIHNNTGFNPHYGCVNRLSDPFLHLARLFSRTTVFFEEPVGVQSAAAASICPAVTIECGVPGAPSATEHAADFVQSALRLTHFPDHPPHLADIDLYRTFAVVKVPDNLSMSFDQSKADIEFRSDIDHLNFSELEAGALFAAYSGDSHVRLNVAPATPEPIAAYFNYSDHEITLAQSTIPAMLTKSHRAIRQDCLCYLMHRIDFQGRRLESE